MKRVLFWLVALASVSLVAAQDAPKTWSTTNVVQMPTNTQIQIWSGASRPRLTIPAGPNANDMLSAKRLTFHGANEDWRGFNLCLQDDKGETCVDAATIWGQK